MEQFVILGAGMAGLGAAHHFYQHNISSIIYEKNNYPGGHAATFKKGEFIFDEGPHISFTSHERLRNLFHKSVNSQVKSFNVNINNYWSGRWIKHPPQVNLYGLPPKLVTKIIKEFFALRETNSLPVNYKDWLLSTYGKTFSKNFPYKYTKKFHTTIPDNLDIDWIGPRMYKPNIDEVLYGALSKETPNVHYVKKFYYPENDGFASFLNIFIRRTNIMLSHRVKELNPTLKTISFNNKKEITYKHLISSIPLPELISIIKGVPNNVAIAAQQLACSSCVFINLGINREKLSKNQWSYFYDEDLIFSRVSFPHLFSGNNTPKKCGSIQAEIYFSKKYKPINRNPEDYIDQTIEGLRRCGILKKEDLIIFREVRYSPYANIIFDLDRISNLSIVHSYLDQIGIKYCGRFGEWGYHWTDQAFISGEQAAKKIIDQI